MYFEKLDIKQIPFLSKKNKSIFTYNANIDNNAYLNWRTSFSNDMESHCLVIADGYFETAHFLLEKCLEDNTDKKADIWIFSILFNIIHGIELNLKAMNSRLNIILKKGHDKIEGGHNIKQLSEVAINLANEYKTKKPSGTNDEILIAIKLVNKFVKNIFDKTNDMTFVRYPVDNKSKEHFYVSEKDNVVINMVLLKKEIEYVITMLEFINDMLEMYFEQQADVEWYS